MDSLIERTEMLECKRVARNVEARIEAFMEVQDGEALLEINDGVQSVLLGFLEDKTVQITIHVQPGLDSDFWEPQPRVYRSEARTLLGTGSLKEECGDQVATKTKAAQDAE